MQESSLKNEGGTAEMTIERQGQKKEKVPVFKSEPPKLESILIEHGFTKVTGAKDLQKGERISKRTSKSMLFYERAGDILVIDKDGDVWMVHGEGLPSRLKPLFKNEKLYIPNPETNLKKMK